MILDLLFLAIIGLLVVPGVLDLIFEGIGIGA
jgi:hypothetical protein